MHRPFSGQMRIGHDLLEKISVQDRIEQTICRNLHILHLMHEERFQPLFLTFIYFKQKPGLRSDQMTPGERDEPFGEWT